MLAPLLFAALWTCARAKSCPQDIPVPFGEISAARCNTSVDPTGQIGDPTCGYDLCEAEDRSAQCWCADYTLVGGSSALWECVHSRCRCFGREGEPCGIRARDAPTAAFLGNATVAGAGCALSGRTGCKCQAALDDGVPREEWVWQCTGDESLVPLALVVAGGCAVVCVLVGSFGIYRRRKKEGHKRENEPALRYNRLQHDPVNLASMPPP